MTRATILLILTLAGLVAATIALATVQERDANEAEEIRPPLVEPIGPLEPDETTEGGAGEADPTTAPIEQAQQVVGELLDYDRWLIWAQRMLLIGIVIVIALILLRIGRRILLNVQKSRNVPDAVMLPIRRTLRGLVLLFALILALQFSGYSMTTIWTTMAGLLALIGAGFIAVWSVLSNILCSVMLLVFKPFRIGDMVELVENAAGPNVGGRVTDVTAMYVVLREETDEGPAFIQIPNNLFFQKTIRRRAGKRAVPLEQHVEKHGLTGREQQPPGNH